MSMESGAYSEKVEAVLMSRIRSVLSDYQPHKPEEVFERVKKMTSILEEKMDTRIREAVWRLMSSGDVELTANRCLLLLREPAERGWIDF